MKKNQIVFTDVKKAELITEELPSELAPKQVLIKTSYTTISCGTERANLMGDKNTAANDANSTAPLFPKRLGYNCSGVVIDVGNEVKNVKIGDRVVGYWSKHASYNLLNESNVVKIEYDDIDMQTAAMSFISTFPLAAIRKTKIEVGESGMVMGLGILGLIAVSLLRVAGAAPVIAVDPNKERREAALKFGADYAFDPFEKDFAEKVKAVTGKGVNVAIEVTGVGAGLDEALDCMAKYGRIALLGCTRDSHFEIDYYHKVHFPGIQLIGAHTNARPSQESYPAYYTHVDDIKAVLKLCAMGRLDLKSMINEVHSPEECAQIYRRLADDKNFPQVVQFKWND